MRNRVLGPISEACDIRGGWKYESRAEGDSVQVGGRGEEYAASNGESPEGEAESQDESVQQPLDGPGSGLGGIFVSRCA